MSLRFLSRAALILGAAIVSLSTAHASVVDYGVTSLGGNLWRYDYTVNNPSPSLGFDEVTIYFDPTKYSLLGTPVAPAGWDPIVVQPDAGIPSDGFFDVLNLSGSLAAGDSFSGFSVSFTYLLTDTPSAQSFDLINSSDFSVVNSGSTTNPMGSTQIPEPASLALVLLGIGCARLTRRRTKHLTL
jgi:hypothetical protein